MFGGITKNEIRVLAAVKLWWKNRADKPATDILWAAVTKMMQDEIPAHNIRPPKDAPGQKRKANKVK